MGRPLIAALRNSQIRRPMAAWLGFALVLSNLLTGLAVAAESGAVSALAKGQLVICTASGIQVIDPVTGKDVTPGGAAGASCIWCLPFSNLSGMAPDPVALPLLARAVLAADPPPQAGQPAERPDIRHHAARAPPVLV